MKILNEELIIELYKTKTLKEIANEIGSYPLAISNVLKKHGIKPKSKFTVKKNVNDNFFDVIDSEEKAYIFGFFIADGCIRKEVDKRCGSISYRLCFSNSILDKEIIDIIHNRICPDNKLIEVHNMSDSVNRKKRCILQWTSRHMVNVLFEKYKLSEHKTMDCNYSLPENVIPREYMRHFVRGMIDGDGTITKSDIRIVLNSPFLGEQIANFFIDEFKKYNDVVESFLYKITEEKGKTTNFWRLRIPTGKGRRKLMEKILYEDSKIFLKRKKDRI